MKSIGSYIGSFILSVLLIFALIASLAVTVVSVFAKPDNIVSLMEQKNINGIVYSELEKYFTSRQNDTGIPANVYMTAIDDELIDYVMYMEINDGFSCLRNGTQAETELYSSFVRKDNSVDKALSDFYSDYAESIGYEKDAKYDEKLSEAQKNAEKVIADYCDVFKFDAMISHGIMKKLSPFYNKLPTVQLVVYGATVMLMLLMILVNIKSTSATLYWIGICSLISGIICAIPCIYLKATDYFSSFTIKQPQIYTAYTSVMISATDTLLKYSVILASISIIFIVGYVLKIKNQGRNTGK
ncbi:MAG: hypothetical protein K2O60_08700 [Ruminococcus sp.]|nr:hypothetical protein [Ruminococcus sp.]